MKNRKLSKPTQIQIHMYVDPEIAERTMILKHKRKLNRLLQELLKEHFEKEKGQGDLFND